MPFIYNGIGTWYYGKRRIHATKGTCEFCHRVSKLESYDTTLFFVVFMVPVVPLGQKRILQNCSVCQKHRVISHSKWEAAKARDSGAVLEKLQNNPQDHQAILDAIGFAIAYQDEPLFDNIVERLVDEKTPDALVQARLGEGYAFFARWREAERAYRASLAIEESEAVRELLAWALLKCGEPREARPYLEHILEAKKIESVGMLYYLIEGYQAEGYHEEALELIDRRDEAFPELAKLKDYQRQRKLAERYRGRDKKIPSALLADASSGYKDGGSLRSRLPYWVALAVPILALLGYFGSAFWIGQSRKIYLVNGTNKLYTVVVQDQKYLLPASSATPIHITEGDVLVSFGDEKEALEPIPAHIETNFWGRPFGGHTFIINPDQAAVVIEEEVYYAVANPQNSKPATLHFGQSFYSLPGFDYEFATFPTTLQVKGTQQVRKTRVALETAYSPEFRLNLLLGLDPSDQLKVCRRALQIDPSNTLFLQWFTTRLPVEEALAFVEPRLEDRPVRVEWHRVYQSLMEKAHPEVDLRPRYRQLVADQPGNPDALYLLGRTEPNLEECAKLYQQAAAANPPSAYAIYGLGFMALSEGRFAEACQWFQKALPLTQDKTLFEHFYRDALLANRDYDALLAVLQPASQLPGQQLSSSIQIIRVYAVRNNKEMARRKLAEVVQLCPPTEQFEVRTKLEGLLCCYEQDQNGYLKATARTPTFESAFLGGDLTEAERLLTTTDHDMIIGHGLLYLEAKKRGDQELAETSWQALLTELSHGVREEKLCGDILAGRKPLSGNSPLKQPIDPDKKRILLAVLAQRYPDKAQPFLQLAKQLDYHHDATSLCLKKVLRKPS